MDCQREMAARLTRPSKCAPEPVSPIRDEAHLATALGLR
jgi:hypothetical protein